MYSQQRRELLAAEAADVAQHDDSPIGQERQRAAGVDRGGDRLLGLGHVLHRERVVARQLFEQRAQGVEHQRRIVALDEVHGHTVAAVTRSCRLEHCGEDIAHAASAAHVVGADDATAAGDADRGRGERRVPALIDLEVE